MTRGPSTGSNRTMSSVAKVAESWGIFPPQWITALAEQCDQTSQRKVAEELGVSTALISNVLGNKYPGDLMRVEQDVNARFMRSEVECPVLGNIPAGECYEHQGRAFSAANVQRVKLFKTCPNCTHFARRRTR